MTHQTILGRGKGIRSKSGRRLAPMMEAIENRQLLTGGAGYLAGTVFLDSTGTGAINKSDAYLAGAKIDLSIAGQSGIIATTTTDAKGAYNFQGLAPGNYILTETPPSNDAPVDASFKSQVYSASKLSSTSIAVTVIDPNKLYAFNNGIDNSRSILANDTLYSRSASDNVGPLNFNLGTTAGGSDVAKGFTTYCVDDESALSVSGGENFQVIPTNINQLTNGAGGTVNPDSAARIAYLYNNYGTTALNNVQAPALQLAIWELIYDSPPDQPVASGNNYKVDGPINASDQARFNQIVQQADAYVAESRGKSETAMFLDAYDPAQINHPQFSQSLVVSSTFDFLNAPKPAPNSSLAGFVYVDNNNSGVKQAGDAPIPGTTITLTGTDNTGANVDLTTTTDATGAYDFANLRPGTYTVTETQPTAYLDGKTTQGTPGTGAAGDNVISNITLNQNVNGTDNNFGELLPSSLAGYVYVDANNSGVRVPSDTPISGTTIALSGTDDLGASVSLTTTTDATGAYDFANLRPGTYTVTETQPTAYLDGKTTQGTPGTGAAGDNVISNITLNQNVNGTDNNFGELLPSSLAGFVYVDANNSGVRVPSDTPISGTTITLSGTNDLGAPVSLTTTTDATGAYDFANLRPGTYTVTETQPTAYLDGKTTQGTPGTGAAGDNVISNITLNQNVNGTDNNFGELLPAPAVSSLSGFVYVDANDNGTRDQNESPIAGTTITLTGTTTSGSPVSETTTTDSTGAYNFANLQAGTYTITETQPSGYLNGATNQGTPGTGTVSTNVISNITLASNVNGVNNNFGEILPSSLAGFVYVDPNNNGIKEIGEAPIPGTTITLTGTDDQGSQVSQTTVTDNNGAYNFSGLRPGSYTITETQPAGYVEGKTTQGTPDTGVAGNGVISNITVGQNITGVNNNFAELLIPTSPQNAANVNSVVLYGIHHQQSTIVASFDGSLNPALANNPANYTLIDLGKGQRLGAGDRNVPIASVSYDPNTNQVTIVPAYHINFHYHYLLTINYPGTSTVKPYSYAEVIGRSSMTVWNYLGRSITPPALTAREAAADLAIKNQVYQQLATQSPGYATPANRPKETLAQSSGSSSNAVQATSTDGGRTSIAASSTKHHRGQRARTPHILVVGIGRRVTLK